MEARSTGKRRAHRKDQWDVPVLDARPGGPAERLAGRLRRHRPATVFFVALLAGFAALAVISIGLGLLVTHVLLQTGGLARTDESAVRSLVAERTPFLTDVSEVGSTAGGAPLLPILVGAIALVCAILRKWRIAAFALFALVVESATYRVTTLAVPRDRPAVKRLEDLPVDASYPSGHTAAAIAVYAGLVLLLTSRFPSRRLRLLAWALAIVVPAFVAASRMYRGMHHPLDVAGGLVIGIGALIVLLFACRAAGVAATARSPEAAQVAASHRVQPVA
jgi:membrane-associated phospholipid phosphatase